MKYIKTFETLRRKPKVGDYVRCQEQIYSTDNGICLFIKSNIGVIVNIKPKVNHPYFIKYINIPANIEQRFVDGVREFSLEEIKRFATAEEIEEYEMKQNAIKYNL